MIFYDADGDGCVVVITDIFFNNFQLGCNFRSDIKTFLSTRWTLGIIVPTDLTLYF